MKLFGRYAAYAIGTVGGVGFTPKIPGTMGSLVALVSLPYLHGVVFGGELLSSLLFIAGLALLGVFSAHVIAGQAEEVDPSCVVIDEYVGMGIAMIPMAFVPREAFTFVGLASGCAVSFVLFRALDIVKPWPIRCLEKIEGAVGIMADDLGAGLAAALGLFALIQFGLLPN